MSPNTHNSDTLFSPSTQSNVFWEELAILGFTESVVKRMDREGISRTELAKRLGSSEAFVTKVLRGSNNFTIKTMVKIARALGCELAAPELVEIAPAEQWEAYCENAIQIAHAIGSVCPVRSEPNHCPAAEYEDLALAA